MKRIAIAGAVVGAAIPISSWFAYAFFGYMAGPEMVVFLAKFNRFARS
jgi:hypothetical protein